MHFQNLLDLYFFLRRVKEALLRFYQSGADIWGPSISVRRDMGVRFRAHVHRKYDLSLPLVHDFKKDKGHVFCYTMHRLHHYDTYVLKPRYLLTV